MDKEIFGYLTLVLTVVAFAPYVTSMVQGKTRPHVFSWIIWGTLMFIGGFAQAVSGAGPGAWNIICSAAFCFVIVILSLAKYGERHIARSDWASFLLALAIVPIWYFTEDALIAIVLVTLIDLIGYYPTFRKAWHAPWSEALAPYTIGSLKFFFSFFAMEERTLATTLYPAALIVANSVFVGIVLIRRRLVSSQQGT